MFRTLKSIIIILFTPILGYFAIWRVPSMFRELDEKYNQIMYIWFQFSAFILFTVICYVFFVFGIVHLFKVFILQMKTERVIFEDNKYSQIEEQRNKIKTKLELQMIEDERKLLEATKINQLEDKRNKNNDK